MGAGGEVDFLPVTKHKNYSIILDLHSQACPEYPKQVYNVFVISQGKREKMNLIFCLQITVKGFFKLLLSF